MSRNHVKTIGDRMNMDLRKKTMEGLNATLRHCHNLYKKYSDDQQALAEMNQAAKDAIEIIQMLEDDVKFFKEYKCVVDALLELGYPHNFQREESWIRNYMYNITGIIKTAYDVMEGRKK